MSSFRMFLCLFALVGNGLTFAEQTATTDDGKKVVLHNDGTWEYAGTFEIGEDNLTNPKPIKQTVPGYTDEAIEKGIEGIVILDCIFRKNGRVDDCKVLKSLDPGLDQRAIDDITRNWRMEPGRRNGQPVDVKARVEVTFNLSESETK